MVKNIYGSVLTSGASKVSGVHEVSCDENQDEMLEVLHYTSFDRSVTI